MKAAQGETNADRDSCFLRPIPAACLERYEFKEPIRFAPKSPSGLSKAALLQERVRLSVNQLINGS